MGMAIFLALDVQGEVRKLLFAQAAKDEVRGRKI